MLRITNHSAGPIHRWVRTTTQQLPYGWWGKIGNTPYVIGRACGVDTRVVDLHVTMDAGATLTLDWAAAEYAPWSLGPLPTDLLGHFGGLVTISGIPMQIVSLAADGAAYSVHLRQRVDRMLCVDLWLEWYPDQPGWCGGEVVITASNPTVPESIATVPAGFDLRFGDAYVLTPGAVPNAPLMTAGDTMADGQARAIPVTFFWLRHTQAAQWSSIQAQANLEVGAIGIDRLLPDGNPHYPPGYTSLGWARGLMAEAVRRSRTWDPAVCGPNPTSTNTGRQWDQIFVAGEPLLAGGVGVEQLLYLSALKMVERPCHHLEADGSQIEPANHITPRLVLWDGRPHPVENVSPDRLGKTAPPWFSVDAAHGRYGPDVEHWLHNLATAAYRYTGSHALQWELSAQARIYLLQCTIVPGWSTSWWFASRAVGYEGILAVHLWTNLEDRVLADRVRTRWRARVNLVFIPMLGNKPGDVWDLRENDGRLSHDGHLPNGFRWLPWQQSLGAYGLDLGCAVLGPVAGRDLALRAAKAVLRDAYVQGASDWAPPETDSQDPSDTLGFFEFPNLIPSRLRRPPSLTDVTRWTTRDVVVLPGPYFEEETRGYYDVFGNACASATVLRHEPTHAQALSIWAQLKVEATSLDQLSWLAPGIGP